MTKKEVFELLDSVKEVEINEGIEREIVELNFVKNLIERIFVEKNSLNKRNLNVKRNFRKFNW